MDTFSHWSAKYLGNWRLLPYKLGKFLHLTLSIYEKFCDIPNDISIDKTSFRIELEEEVRNLLTFENPQSEA